MLCTLCSSSLSTSLSSSSLFLLLVLLVLNITEIVVSFIVQLIAFNWVRATYKSQVVRKWVWKNFSRPEFISQFFLQPYTPLPFATPTIQTSKKRTKNKLGVVFYDTLSYLSVSFNDKHKYYMSFEICDK